jgi:transglutaminase-like putative cysteine protease
MNEAPPSSSLGAGAARAGPALRVPPALRRLGEVLRRLPRETRDTLLLLAVIAFTSAPHLAHLPPWCGTLVVAVLAWRAYLALSGRPMPGRWVMWALLLLTGGLTLWSERTLLGREAGVTMLVALLALKTLELRARRDALVVFFLGFFLLLTQFLYSQSLLTGLWMLFALWGLLSALVLAHMPVGRPRLAQAAAVAARATLLGLPLMALLFVLFPRIGPLWGLPQDAAGKTGLSGTLRLGGVAEIANDDSIAFRVRFDGPRPLDRQLYFRGPVLATTDGREWNRLVPTVAPMQRARAELQTRGEPLRYEMTLEPGRLTVLPLLEATPDQPGAAPQREGWLFSLRPDLQWQSDRPLAERIRVEARAWLEFRHGPREPLAGLRDFMRLPPNAHPRVRAWAALLRQQPELRDADAASLTQAVLQHIRRGGFTYTLEPGSYDGDPIDEFWFDRKLGFCEHFAAAYVVVMRALDVPARIVTGYQGTDPDLQDGYWIVRQSNAHAWAEYWQAGLGWVRVDPTAAVAPERVQAGRSLRPAPGLVAGALRTIDPALAARLRSAWESLNNRWNQWVLNYSRSQQFDFMRALGFAAPSWQDLATLLVSALCAVALAGAAWAWWDRHRQDPWQRLSRRVQRRLAALGVSVMPHEPPRTRAQRVRERLGAAGESLAAHLDALDRLRYAQGTSPRALRRTWWPGFSAAARRAPRNTA